MVGKYKKGLFMSHSLVFFLFILYFIFITTLKKIIIIKKFKNFLRVKSALRLLKVTYITFFYVTAYFQAEYEKVSHFLA